MSNPTLAASRAATLPEPAFRIKWLRGTRFVVEPVSVKPYGDTDCYTEDQMRAAIAAMEAAQPASPAPLTDERLQELGELREGLGNIAARVMSEPTMLKCCRLVDAELAALASPQVAPAPEQSASEWMDGEDIGMTKKQVDRLIDGAAKANSKPVAWRYKPSKVLAGTVLTDDPEMFKLASEHGCDIEPLYLAAPAQVAPTIEEMCARIKAADDAAADRDYMLDSDDCISVLRGTWAEPLANDHPKPRQVAPQDDARDAAEALTDEREKADREVWYWMGETETVLGNAARASLVNLIVFARTAAIDLPKVHSEPEIWVKFEDGQLIGWDDVIPDGEYFLAARSTPAEQGS